MAFCSRCGAELNGDVQFCPSCGQPVGGQQAQQQTQKTQQQSRQQKAGASGGKAYNMFAAAPDYTAECDPADIQQNKVFGILAYIGILVLVPIFAAPKSKYVRVHANAGLNLLILEILVTLVFAGLKAIIFPYYWIGRGIGGYVFLSVIQWLLMIVLLAFAVLGIVYAATGKAKEIPLINKIKLLK